MTLQLGAQLAGKESWVTGGSTYPWPLHDWVDARVDPNSDSLSITSIVQDAEAHQRWHPLGSSYQPLPGDWVLFDNHVEVVTGYSGGVLSTIGGDSLPNFSVNAHEYSRSLSSEGVQGFVSNGDLPAASTAAAKYAGPRARARPAELGQQREDGGRFGRSQQAGHAGHSAGRPAGRRGAGRHSGHPGRSAGLALRRARRRSGSASAAASSVAAAIPGVPAGSSSSGDASSGSAAPAAASSSGGSSSQAASAAAEPSATSPSPAASSPASSSSGTSSRGHPARRRRSPPAGPGPRRPGSPSPSPPRPSPGCPSPRPRRRARRRPIARARPRPVRRLTPGTRARPVRPPLRRARPRSGRSSTRSPRVRSRPSRPTACPPR